MHAGEKFITENIPDFSGLLFATTRFDFCGAGFVSSSSLAKSLDNFGLAGFFAPDAERFTANHQSPKLV